MVSGLDGGRVHIHVSAVAAERFPFLRTCDDPPVLHKNLLVPLSSTREEDHHGLKRDDPRDVQSATSAVGHGTLHLVGNNFRGVMILRTRAVSVANFDEKSIGSLVSQIDKGYELEEDLAVAVGVVLMDNGVDELMSGEAGEANGVGTVVDEDRNEAGTEGVGLRIVLGLAKGSLERENSKLGVKKYVVDGTGQPYHHRLRFLGKIHAQCVGGRNPLVMSTTMGLTMRMRMRLVP